VTSAAKKILEQALALPRAEQLELLEDLGKAQLSVELESELHFEVSRRMEEIEAGEVEVLIWSDVEAGLNETIARVRGER